MTHATGWILDFSIEQNRATILVKTTEGNILNLLGTYKPNFYILPKDEKEGADLFQILNQESMVEKVEWEHKFTDLFKPILKKLISVYTKSTVVHNTLIKKLKMDTRVAQLFNTDLSHVQQYLFNTLKIEPTRKVGVEYKEDNARLWRFTKINEYEVVPPSFSILYIDGQIRARYQAEPEVHFEGDEEFHDYVVAKDPDIIVSTNGRESSPLKDRVLLHNKSIYDELDLAGLIERARFGFLPMSLAARYGMNRLIDSRNCYTLIQRGFVIPSRGANMNHEPIRTLEEINSKDKGGMIFSPTVGLHENVVVLDYENEYANLILKHHETSEEECLLPTVLEKVLRRRIFFKNLQKSFSVDTTEWIWCEQRINILKSILVSLYGTSGSFWNRFANVETFEEINRLSREILVKTKDIVQAHGFELLYADTDSVFLRKDGARIKEYENIKKILSRETGLPISIERHFKFLVLLPLEASESTEALKHYFGITWDNELIARGIEIRRHDAPNFIKEFQTELLYTLFDYKNTGEVLSKGYENALLLVTQTIDKVMTGEIQLQDLVVTKILGMGLDKYRSLFPHVSAAIQLTKEGRSTLVGEGVEYIYTNSGHTNPLCRVAPRALIEQHGEFNYDKEKYRDTLLESVETVLGYFGFDRSMYGDAPKKSMKWWQKFNEEKLKDRDTETT